MNHLKRAGLAVALSVAAGSAEAQLGMFSSEQRVAITSEWAGERFPDGRPKVADGVLERMKEVTAEEAWGVLTGAGYKSQFEGGWKEITLHHLLRIRGIKEEVPSSLCFGGHDHCHCHHRAQRGE